MPQRVKGTMETLAHSALTRNDSAACGAPRAGAISAETRPITMHPPVVSAVLEPVAPQTNAAEGGE